MCRNDRSCSAFGRAESGASAVEFALVAPVFVLMLLGMLVYGLYFGVSHGIAQIAAEAARASIAGTSNEERVSLATARVAALVESYPFLDMHRMAVEAAPVAADPNLFRVGIVYDASNMP